MRKILFPGVVLICNLVSAQNLTKVLPPSPTASELGRAGLAVSNLVTGELRTEIPLYTLTTPHLKLPVSLSYSAGGLKVNAIASRQGQNVLNAALNPKIYASQTVTPGFPLNMLYKKADVVAPNNLYNAALQVKGAQNIKGPKSVTALPYLNYYGK